MSSLSPPTTKYMGSLGLSSCSSCSTLYSRKCADEPELESSSAARTGCDNKATKTPQTSCFHIALPHRFITGALHRLNSQIPHMITDKQKRFLEAPFNSISGWSKHPTHRQMRRVQTG